ncbi:hypothetical protein GQ53DRAFT_370906 [Thozetella sp. PMI_491]|nr:hypothetical protein GQ53DRAFT_370906 [Thozetella sp. PMI_491]
MGNLCGKASSDPFDQPGRTLGSAPVQPTKASVPSKRSVGGPPRTLGSSNAGASSQAGRDDARRKAAEAAEARAQGGSKSTGKLGAQLAAQKKQTRSETLKEASETNRLQREADANTSALNHN